MAPPSRTRTIPIDRARRIALAAQGFTDPKPTGAANVRHFRRVMERMSILQIDSVNVLSRSHFLPVLARLGPYDRDRLDDFLWRSGENVEYFAHVASLTSVDHRPLLRHRMEHYRGRWLAKLEEELPGYATAVRDEVADRGPLAVGDLEEPGGRTGPWWGHSKGKQALTALYLAGELAISDRTSTFLTVYDLPERVIPPEVLSTPTPSLDDAHREMVRLGLKSHGIATAADVADYFRIKMTSARTLLDEMVEAGEIEAVDVAGWKERAYLDPEAKTPRAIDRAAFLSPFDPVVWFRDRAERLFDFHYRIEIYVPEPKRVHGYYVLPFLLGDQVVGRVDMKADRKQGRLLAKAAFAEPGVDRVAVAAAMAGKLEEMAAWMGLDAIEAGRRGDLSGALRSALG